MVRTKNKPRPEVVLQGRMDTLKKLNNVGRRIAVQVLKAMDVDTHEFDGPFDLVSGVALRWWRSVLWRVAADALGRPGQRDV